MTERECKIALSTFTLFGPVRIRLLYQYFDSSIKIWNATEKDLLQTNLNPNLVAKFLFHRKTFDLTSYLQKINNLNIKVLLSGDIDYPANLNKIPDKPEVLYVRGELSPIDELSVAIVGTRQMTTYGREVVQKFSRDLSNYGITVISGLALGIDAEAQKTAFQNGGRTISVLASGVDIITPATNRSLAMSFIKNQGAIVSEYPMGYMPRPYDFPLRDRLIAGLAKAVLVIEGRMKSGTFYTVKAALDQGNSVFAVPGPINSVYSEATNYLIQNGAKPMLNINDILEELGVGNVTGSNPANMSFTDDKLGSMLIKILSRGPSALDEIVRISGVSTAEVSAKLTLLELNGVVKNLGNSKYGIL